MTFNAWAIFSDGDQQPVRDPKKAEVLFHLWISGGDFPRTTVQYPGLKEQYAIQHYRCFAGNATALQNQLDTFRALEWGSASYRQFWHDTALGKYGVVNATSGTDRYLQAVADLTADHGLRYLYHEHPQTFTDKFKAQRKAIEAIDNPEQGRVKRMGFAALLETRAGILRQTVLMSAVAGSRKAQDESEAGHLETVKILLRHKARINAKDVAGNTVLHFLAVGMPTKVSKDIFEVLIANGADYNLKNRLGQTPLSLAILMNNLPAIVRLVPLRDLDISEQDRVALEKQAHDNPVFAGVWNTTNHIKV